MMTAASRAPGRQTGSTDEDRAPQQTARAAPPVNPVWTGLALGGVVQRTCAECAAGGSCPSCEEDERPDGM